MSGWWLTLSRSGLTPVRTNQLNLAHSRSLSSAVSIIEFSPKEGPVATTVRISGTSFSPVPSENTVRFNGVQATVTSSTATQITTSVPAGATTGPISVTAPGGSATSTTPFTVAATGAPTITSFTPNRGTPGTPVTITGTNFETTPFNNYVRLNTTYATVSSSPPPTSTAIATSVPAGTGSGRISVTTPSGNATSTSDFFIPPSPYTVADVDFTARMAIGGSTQTVTISTANKIALVVFDGIAGRRVTLNLSGVTFIARSYVSINNPDGAILADRLVDSGGGSITATPTCHRDVYNPGSHKCHHHGGGERDWGL